MKVIFSRIYIDKANEGSPIQDRTSLLVWYLSALKWKKLGYETILYTDETTKKAFDELGLSDCYDMVKMIEVDDSIEEDVFWACAKLLAEKQFMNEYPDEEFIISDLDFIPMVDPMTFKNANNNIITFYREYWQSYCPLEYLGLNPEWKMPEYFTGKVDPLNVCMLYISQENRQILNEYLDVAINFMHMHKEFINGEKANNLMIFIEQRLFTEYLESLSIPIITTMPYNKSVFNVVGMHTGAYKSIEKREYWKWIIWYFKMLKEEFEETFESIIALPLYEDIKDIIENGGIYVDKTGKETYIGIDPSEFEDASEEVSDEYYDGEEITEESESEDTESDESDEEVIEEPFIFDWDGLAYPRAFEDIYDPIWSD